MPKFRRGVAAVEAAATSSKGGSFAPFVPELFWKDDGDKKYILVLTPSEEVCVFDLHDFIKLQIEKADGSTFDRFESFISRKDEIIGEDFDKIEDELGKKSKVRCMGVAVELEPVLKDVKGRKRPVEFAVKTDTFTKKGDDGEEEVEYPKIGIISQSSKLMWSPLNGLDESQGPLIDLPLEVVRRIPGGEKSNTSYEFVPFMDIPVDLSAIVEYLDGISYLSDDLDEIVEKIEATETDAEAAQAVADHLLIKRVEELADGERYEELLGDVDELELPSWEKGKKKTEKKTSSKSKRTARPSQRKAKKTTEEEQPTDEAESEETSDEPEVEPEEPKKGDKFAALKARIESK